MTSPTDPSEQPAHPLPGVPVALEPEDEPGPGPLTAEKVTALIPKIID